MSTASPVAPSAAKRSPVHDRHEAAGAKFSEFGGWSMPLEYAGAGVLAEHTAVRTAVGLFDVSHLGKIGVTGPGAADFVNRCLTADLRKIAPGQAQYTLICNDDGGVVDDLIAYLNGTRRRLPDPQRGQLRRGRPAAHGGGAGRDRGRGPARRVRGVRRAGSAQRRGAGGGRASGRPRLHVLRPGRPDGVPLTICRTGYTGERGYELVVPGERSGVVWDAVVAAGEPYGIQLGRAGCARHAAHRDGLPAARPGHLARHLARSRPGWAGRSAGRRTPSSATPPCGPRRKPPRTACSGACGPSAVASRGPGMLVRDADGHEIGSVTSGTFSPTLKTGIALALLDSRSWSTSRSRSTSGAGGGVHASTKPPFVTPGGPRAVTMSPASPGAPGARHRGPAGGALPVHARRRTRR